MAQIIYYGFSSIVWVEQLVLGGGMKILNRIQWLTHEVSFKLRA